MLPPTAASTTLVYDAVILSDLHLGSDNCQAKHLCEFLERIEDGRLRTARLILNGDVFDSIDFRRLKKTHWKVLSLIRKLSDQIDIIWLCGNHDGSADIVSHLLGTRVEDEHTLASGPHQVLILHGHRFDEFLDAHPILTLVSDMVYYLLLRVDRTHRVARLAKKSSKTFLRCAQKIEERSREYARGKGCTVVCCGHTHQAISDPSQDVHYFNSGCWTELPCTYLTVRDGRIELQAFEPEVELLAAEPATLITRPMLWTGAAVFPTPVAVPE
ncbi:MAG: UDP-2,3-diacylglucosamine diphosphatase [Planctomycetia bacterium]|nr:UDP-2,3-diacylglucosamine diphosphatase [Planctomycetia bacterium]